jgi:hypothetical protein
MTKSLTIALEKVEKRAVEDFPVFLYQKRVVYKIVGSRGNSSDLRRGSGRFFPKAKMFEDFLFYTSATSFSIFSSNSSSILSNLATH